MAGRTRAVDASPSTLSTADYERVREAARTYREAIVVRLCGEVGLRPREIARVTPADFRTESTRNGTHHLVTVPGGDEAGGPVRTGYVPSAVSSAITRYVNERGIGQTERLVEVTPRRIQMLVAEVAGRAAETAGDEALQDVSSRDLCRYYARQLVHEEGVDPRIVLSIGPWEGLDSLSKHLDPVDTGTVLDALERTGISGPGAGWGAPALGRTVESVDLGVLVLEDGTIEYANDGFASLTGFAHDELAGREVAAVYENGDDAPATDGESPTRVRLRRRDGEPVPTQQVTAGVSSPGQRELVVFLETDDDGPESEPAGPGQTPERLAAGIEALHAATAVLGTASNRSEIVSQVCECIAANDAYQFAWIGSVTRDSAVVSSAWDGIDEDTAERLAEGATGDAETAKPSAVDASEVRVVDVDANATLDSVADSGAEQGCAVSEIAYVPLAYGDTMHGVLALGTAADPAFGAEERQLLASLGWQVGQALTDIERRNLLLADSVLELSFRTQSEESFFVAASEQLGASFELQGLVPGESQSLLYFVMVRETTPEEVVSLAADADSIESARLIRDYGESYLAEFVIEGEEPATTLTELGGQVTEFVVEDGVHRVTADFTGETDVRAVFNGFQSKFPQSNLSSKQEVERPVQTTEGFRRSLEDDLTDKQQSVLRAAYLAGYFEWPRGSTAEELADSIGVSSPTLHNHLRKAQQKVLTAFFETLDE